MKKVIVIGCPGSGKSTLARALHKACGLPLYHLDMIYHLPDRTTLPRDAFDAKLTDILSQDQFIIDGNYHRTLEMRMQACDTIILLDLPTEVCLAGAMSRIGKKREDMPWVETELDEEFRQFICDFSSQQLPLIYELIDIYKADKEIVILHSHEEVDAYLARLLQKKGQST